MVHLPENDSQKIYGKRKIPKISGGFSITNFLNAICNPMCDTKNDT